MCVNKIHEERLACCRQACYRELPTAVWDGNPTAGIRAADAVENGRKIRVSSAQFAEVGTAILLLIWLGRHRAWKPLPLKCAAACCPPGGILTVSRVFSARRDSAGNADAPPRTRRPGAGYGSLSADRAVTRRADA